jgi:hypothetical protein
MSWSPSPSWIQRWFPAKWSEMIGNAAVKRIWMNFLLNGLCNALFTGPTRSGKTRMISLGIRALVCTNRTDTLDPCGKCAACKTLGEGRTVHNGVFAAMCGSEYSYHPIDCENVTAEELDALTYDGGLDSDKAIVYLDEVGALRRRRLEGKVLKLADETPAIWIASAITVRPKKELRRKAPPVVRLSEELRGRFPVKIGTSHPHPDDIHDWIVDRCREWNIIILDEEVTIPAMIKRTRRRVGYLIHLLAFAATKANRTLSLDDVLGFNFDAAD